MQTINEKLNQYKKNEEKLNDSKIQRESLRAEIETLIVSNNLQDSGYENVDYKVIYVPEGIRTSVTVSDLKRVLSEKLQGQNTLIEEIISESKNTIDVLSHLIIKSK